jgi:hypothetical protein
MFLLQEDQGGINRRYKLRIENAGNAVMMLCGVETAAPLCATGASSRRRHARARASSEAARVKAHSRESN